MGFLNEQIDVNIKMSKRVKYFFIGLFIGIISSFIGIYISSEFFVEPILTENIQNSYNAGLKEGFHIADSLYKETLGNMPLSGTDFSLNKIKFIDYNHSFSYDDHLLGIILYDDKIGEPIPTGYSYMDLDNLIISKAKKMGGNRILQRRNIPPMYEIYYHRNRLFE